MFQGWFDTLSAFETSPVAAYAAACAVYHLVETLVEMSVDRGGVQADMVADMVLAAAREAADRALLARPGEFEVMVATRDPLTFDHDDERIAALVTRNGGSRWARQSQTNGLPETCGIATFPSVRHAVDAKDALRADEAVEGLSAGPDWDHLFR